jgi:hypothetical protein
MVEPIGAVGTAASLVSLGAQALAAVKKDGVGRLRGLVAADLRSAHEIDDAWRERVAAFWSSQGVDPTLNGALAGWLASGDARYVGEIEERWRSLLGALGLDRVGIEAVLGVTAHSLRSSFARAQPDEIAAIHAEAERVLQGVNVSADTVVRRIGEIVGELVGDLQRSGGRRMVRLTYRRSRGRLRAGRRSWRRLPVRSRRAGAR